MKIFSGNSNLPFAQAVTGYMDTSLSKCSVRRFADNEIFVEVQETVRGQDVFIIQPTSSPVNDHLMELLIMLDTFKRSSARRITAVIPYFGYARQDRRSAPRTPISAKLVANLITSAGANRVVTMDLHAGQIQGFFDIPLDNLTAAPVIVKDILYHFRDKTPMIVSPDVGGVVRARAIAKRLNADLAIIDKRRERAGVSEVMNIIGDVAGQDCILVDDIVDSAGTLCNAAVALKNAGASSVHAYVTHGVLSGEAVKRVTDSPLESLVITDTIAPTQAVKDAKNIRVVSVAELVGESILRISEERSITSLFY
ncbi:MAG: ribose-phosphate pyrophosphokinase [Alphaproteobacteria bacterium]|nr:ribose-phosphate pyrophosphokinase [Alphaproteobacteria bacterium]MBO4643582.1 ribose-phosphate pyrophosphokinase [Alphaproteobacteria bacterium]